jgi:dihydroorotate dehydrogenase
MYRLIQPVLFALDAERAHGVALNSLQLAYRLGLGRFFSANYSAPCSNMGLSFQNPIGLAAGFDKNADFVDALSLLGFGFIEIGTVTPKPQTGNPRPRLFRLTEQRAIINRMGFNNKGVEYVAKRLEKTKYTGILGINIGKNRDTLIENAMDDYIFGFRHLSPFASYITINISSPNTPGLRTLQQQDFLIPLLSSLKAEQQNVLTTINKYVPLVVKISPDLSLEELQTLSDIFLQHKIDGIIATNTTTTREGIQHSRYHNETGGLSGQPLQQLSSRVIKTLHSLLQGNIPIIASGGILDKASAQEKFTAGASLLQIYTGLIYHGPGLITQLLA